MLSSDLNAYKLGVILQLATDLRRQVSYIARRSVFEGFGRYFVQAGADAFLCTFPLASCQFWLPFGLPIIAVCVCVCVCVFVCQCAGGRTVAPRPPAPTVTRTSESANSDLLTGGDPLQPISK